MFIYFGLIGSGQTRSRIIPQTIVFNPPNDQWPYVKVKQNQIEGTAKKKTIRNAPFQQANKCPMNQISGQTVCQLAEQKVLHIKGTQLCLPHLFITFSLIQFPFPIPPLNFSFSLGKSESPCWYFVSISLGSIENCFDFYCLSALNPCAMHSKQWGEG